MSAYVKNETAINDVSCLLEALKNKGYTDVEVSDKPRHLIGYHGEKRADTAEVIIRRKHIGSLSNDIGFKKNDKGNYDAIISEYDSGKHDAKWLESLKQDYGVIKAKSIAKKNGWTMLKQTDNNGKTKMQFVVRT